MYQTLAIHAGIDFRPRGLASAAFSGSTINYDIGVWIDDVREARQRL